MKCELCCRFHLPMLELGSLCRLSGPWIFLPKQFLLKSTPNISYKILMYWRRDIEWIFIDEFILFYYVQVEETEEERKKKVNKSFLNTFTQKYE